MNINPQELVTIVRKRKSLLIWPTIIMTVVAMMYAVLRPTQWSATQALHVRDQSVGTATGNGRFESTDAMQTAQETIYEIARHGEVLKGALKQVGPAKKNKPGKPWPTQRQTERFRKCVYVDAPQGVQFGRTELIYLTVRDRKRDRAVALTSAVSAHLIERMQRLQEEKYKSIIAELQKTVVIARQDLENATSRLEHMEQQVGADIAELRVLMDQGQGEGNVRRTLSEAKAELRRERNVMTQKQVELDQLRSIQNDPHRLIVAANPILDAQPTLKRLKEGLVDAQLNTARLMGLMSEEHPQVQAAQLAEDKIREELHLELRTAIQGLDTDLQAVKERLRTLQGYIDISEGRMGKLAGIRTRYSNLANEVRQRTEFLQRLENELTEARANKISATAVSLIHRVDEPVPSTDPVGPSRKLIVLVGLLAGMATGLGLIYIMEPDAAASSRRISDTLQLGRRASDSSRTMLFGRRVTDRANRRANDLQLPPPATDKLSESPTARQEKRDRRQQIDSNDSTTPSSSTSLPELRQVTADQVDVTGHRDTTNQITGRHRTEPGPDV